MNKCK